MRVAIALAGLGLAALTAGCAQDTQYPRSAYGSYPSSGYGSYPSYGYSSYPSSGYRSYPSAGYSSYPTSGYNPVAVGTPVFTTNSSGGIASTGYYNPAYPGNVEPGR